MKRFPVFALSILLTAAGFGFTPRALQGGESSRETIQWHLDYFIDTTVFDEADYQMIGGPWSRILDPARARINGRLNRVLQTATEDGPGSVSYTLPKTLLPGEYPLEIVFDIGSVPVEEPEPEPEPEPEGEVCPICGSEAEIGASVCVVCSYSF